MGISKVSSCKHLKQVASCYSLISHLKWNPSEAFKQMPKTLNQIGGNSKAPSTVKFCVHMDFPYNFKMNHVVLFGLDLSLHPFSFKKPSL